MPSCVWHPWYVDDQERLRALGKRVRRRREARGLTIDEAAGLAPMSPVTWARVEHGKRVRGLAYGAVDDVLGWQEGACYAYLATGDEPTPVVERDPDVRGEDETDLEWMDRQYELSKHDQRKRTILENLFESWGGQGAG